MDAQPRPVLYYCQITHLDGSLSARAFLRFLAMDWLGGRLLYWFQNCSEEQGVEGPLESEEVEEGVEEAEETEEARDLWRSKLGFKCQRCVILLRRTTEIGQLTK